MGDPTHAALYNPAQPFVRRAISPEGDRSDWFGVAPELIREVISGFAPAAQDAEHVRFTVMQAPIDATTYRLQRAIFDYVRTESDPDVLTVEENVIDVLCRLLWSVYGRPLEQCTTVRRHRELAENTRAHLAAHYARKESLTDVARALGCSVFHLCRVFRRHTGRTLHDYRQELRVRHALELVSAGSRDLLDVAIALGYSSHSHFTAAFREAFGEPPSIVRATTLMACITRLSSTTAWPYRTGRRLAELDKLPG